MSRYRRAVLLFNPQAGTNRRRPELIHRIADVFRSAADEVILEPTRCAGSAGEQARKAIVEGADLIVACGGDGTMFEVLQGIATTSATLAVVPLGTGNVLALDLDLPDDPVAAGRKVLDYNPRRIALGRISYNGGQQSRYFTVAAGVGVHAELIYRSTAAAKNRGGIAAYYLSGFDLLFRHEFVPFEIEVTLPDGSIRRDQVQELVAMRVRSFGRWLKRYRPGSSLDLPHMQLIVLRKSSRAAMVRYVVGALTGTAHRADRTSRSADVEFISATRVRCWPIPAPGARDIRAQADGEMLGCMPAELEIVPDSLTLLMPGG